MIKNVCIVGYGCIAPVHASALLQLPDEVKIYAICDIVKEKADKGAEKYGAKAYYSIDEALDDSEIDVFHICTPHYLHFPMIEKCLAKGKMVVSEKPLVMTRDELKKASAFKDSHLYCIFQNRTNNSVLKLKEIIESDKTIGHLTGIRAIMTWKRTAHYYRSGPWRGKIATEGGGVLINQSIHTLDLMCLFGGKVVSAEAKMSNHSLKGEIEVEDTVEAYVKFENGASGIFYATNANAFDSPTILDISFENASFRYIDGRLYKGGELLASDTSDAPGKACWGNGHEREFFNIYKGNSPLKYNDVENTLKTVFAFYESAKNDGKEIIL